jgi:chromosome segregation ATPase
MTRDHSQAVDKRRRAIEEIEKKYASALGGIEAKHRAKMARLESNLRDVQQRTRVLLRAARHLEHTNQNQLRETMKEFELMKSRADARSAGEMVRQDDVQRLEAQKKQLENLKRRLVAKDDVLSETRGRNQELKRELWGIRHEIRFAAPTTRE